MSQAEACVLSEEPYVIVMLRREAPPGTVAHEALHATKRALEFAGVRFSAATEEVYAYTLDWVVTWLTACLERAR
jgi:hypothetical protein